MTARGLLLVAALGWASSARAAAPAVAREDPGPAWLVIELPEVPASLESLGEPEPDADVKAFESFLFARMQARGVRVAGLSQRFREHLRAILAMTAQETPIRFHCLARLGPGLREAEVAKIFLALRDDPEGFPLFVLAQVRFLLKSGRGDFQEAKVPELAAKEYIRYQSHRSILGDLDIQKVFSGILGKEPQAPAQASQDFSGPAQRGPSAQPRAAAAAPAPASPSPEARPAVARTEFIVEALIDGHSELHLTPVGLYWVNRDFAKPGRHNGLKEPTFVNGARWQPLWGRPREDNGWDATDLYPVKLGRLDFGFAVANVSFQRGQKGFEVRGPVSLGRLRSEQVIYISDDLPGSRWYIIELFRKP